MGMATMEMPIMSRNTFMRPSRIRHPARQNAAGGVADRAHDQSHASPGPRSGMPTLLANGTSWLMTISPAAHPSA